MVMRTTMLLEENTALKQRLAEREDALVARDAQLSQREERVDELERQIEELCAELRVASRDRLALEARLKELLQKRRRLDTPDAAGQLSLLYGDEEPSEEPPPHVGEAPDGETPKDPIKRRHRTKCPARELDYAALPREHVWHELPEDERVCPVTGLELLPVGEKTTEEIEYRPARLVVIEHHRVVYGLPEELAKEWRVQPLVAPMPPRPIENGDAGAGLLSWVLVQKYRHHLPLYRQETIFAREGLRLPRQTMCDWVMACAELLGPIQRAMQREIVASGVVQSDDTPVLCQGSKGSGKFQAYLWTYTSPLVEGVVYDFTPSRGHEHVKAFLGERYEGYLVGDGYAGFGTIANASDSVTETGCWAHAIRKFRDALKESPKEASEMMTLIKKLFDVETEATKQKLSFEERKALREERSRPVLERIEARRKELKGRYSDQETMAKALGYLKNQWATLEAFLEDGRVPIHNNACERAIRPIAIGRRNWLFAGSERGGQAAATAYTMIESCRRVDVDPFAYLRDVLVRVSTHPASRVTELTPARWKELFGSDHVG